MDSLRIQRRTRLRAIAREAEALAQTAYKLHQAAQEAEQRGASLDVQHYMAFLTGAHARVLKDWGVVEHLQAIDAERKGPKR